MKQFLKNNVGFNKIKILFKLKLPRYTQLNATMDTKPIYTILKRNCSNIDIA